MTRVAAVDIGSNTTRLLVVDIDDGGLAWVRRRSTVTGLGRGLDATDLISASGMDDTVAALRAYAADIGAYDVDAIAVVATAACREAENREEFLVRAAQVLGVRPAVVSGEEEAALSFVGALAGVTAPPPYLVIDPGGGSTEFVFGSAGPEYSISTKMGSVRLTERSLPDHPASPEQVSAAAAEAAREFASVALPGPAATVVGVGGTFTALAAISLDLNEHDPDVVHGTVLTPADVDRLVEDLALLTVEQTAAIPSLDPARAPVLLGGAVVVREATRRVGDPSAVVSENDILTGMALRAASS